MGTDQRRVVVTGLGTISPVGADVATTWKSLLAGHSGVVELTDSWAGELPARIAAWAAADPAALLDRTQARRTDRCEQLGIVAAREAWADAGAPEVDPERLGVVVSSGIGGIASNTVGLRHVAGEGLAADLTVHDPDAHAERVRGLDRP